MADAKSILIVEDEADLREILVLTLEAAGYLVSSAGNGLLALAELDQRRVALVLCDFNMPVMNGVELLAAVRERGNAVPFIFLSGDDSSQARFAMRKSDGASFLLKPFDVDVVRAAIANVLGSEAAA